MHITLDNLHYRHTNKTTSEIAGQIKEAKSLTNPKRSQHVFFISGMKMLVNVLLKENHMIDINAYGHAIYMEFSSEIDS